MSGDARCHTMDRDSYPIGTSRRTRLRDRASSCVRLIAERVRGADMAAGDGYLAYRWRRPVDEHREGDAIAGWQRLDGSSRVAQLAGYDAAGPQIQHLTVPASVRVGEPFESSVAALDVWMPIVATSWTFDDGSVAAGSSVTHQFAGAGEHSVRVEVVDALGNARSETRAVSVIPVSGVSTTPTPGTPAQPVAAGSGGPPTLSALRLTRRTMSPVGERATRPRSSINATYFDSQAARTTITIRLIPGRGKRARPVGSFTHLDRVGANRVRLPKRLNGRALRAGRYRITLRATNTDGQRGNTLAASFRVTP